MLRILLVVGREQRRPDTEPGPGRWFACPRPEARIVPEGTAHAGNIRPGRRTERRPQISHPPAPDVLAAYISSLRIEDLALAVACVAGDELAWEHVVITYRPILYRAASVLTGDDAAGRELADTLCAELTASEAAPRLVDLIGVEAVDGRPARIDAVDSVSFRTEDSGLT
jgi:hypothetical protein